MAKPIKETPVLKGKDAKDFLKNAREAEEGKRNVSREEYERAIETYSKIVKKSNINF